MAYRSAYIPTLILALVAVSGSPAQAQGLKADHLYNLSDFSGTVPLNGGRLVLDKVADEVYVLASNQVQMFNRAGMQTYSFKFDTENGLLRDAAVDEDGDILILSNDPAVLTDAPFIISRCDYRGQVKQRFVPDALPDEFARILPDRIFYRNGRLFLVSRPQKLVVVVDPRTGEFERGHDLVPALKAFEEDLSGRSIDGFYIDDAENMLFTIPVMFRAFNLSPQGKMDAWGQAGSAPGSFSIVAGIVTDGDGLYFVADRSRNVVLAFDENYQFLTEFGHRGDRPENLIRPNDLALDGGKLYVTQMKSRGVAAFSVSD